MKTTCISLADLYNKFGEKLTYGTIEKSYQEETDTEYFDFYNNKHGLSCMDGEVVYIEYLDDNIVELINKDGEIDTSFKLSKEEFEIANIH